MRAIRRITPAGVTELGDLPAVGGGDGGVLWVDLVGPTAEEAQVLAQLGLRRHTIEAILEDTHHPRVDDHGDYLSAVVHAVDIDATAQEFCTREVDVVLGDGWLLTHAAAPVDAVEAVRARVTDAPRLAPTATRLLYELCDTLVDVYLPYLELVDSRIDEVEALIFPEAVGRRSRTSAPPPAAARDEIYFLRRDVITLRRIAVPQAEALGDLARRLADGPPDRAADADGFRELRDKLSRMAELAASYRDLLDGALDQYQSAVANAQNEVMKVLTMLSGVLLPITVVAGIYGMNFQYMPELDERWGYPAVWLLNVTIVVSVLGIFRARGWIGRSAQERRRERAAAADGGRSVPVAAVGRVLRLPAIGARAVGAAAATPLRAAARTLHRR